MNAVTPTSPIDIGKRVSQYVALRDMIADKKKKQKEELKPLQDLLDKLNSVLLGYLNALNQNSANTDGGTVYRTADDSVSIADPDAFMRHVIGTESWELIDRKANKTAVKAFIEEHKSPPPGVNFTSSFVVGVKRPTK